MKQALSDQPARCWAGWWWRVRCVSLSLRGRTV